MVEFVEKALKLKRLNCMSVTAAQTSCQVLPEDGTNSVFSLVDNGQTNNTWCRNEPLQSNGVQSGTIRCQHSRSMAGACQLLQCQVSADLQQTVENDTMHMDQPAVHHNCVKQHAMHE